VNADRSESVTSRVAGRIEKLYVKETGKIIQKGQPLYQLYSEILLTLQREYLLAKEQYETLGSTEKRYKSFYEAAKRKLLLYGLTEQQIDVLSKTKSLQNSIVILSPSTGTIADLSVTEGQYVTEGTILMRLEDINQLWVEAELYPSETSLFNVGDKITVRISGYENEPTETVIDFMSPGYSGNGHIVAVRASIPNTKLKYTPGMQAQVHFSYSTREALAVPIDAVIRDEMGSHVFIQRGQNTFRSEKVKTGMENFENVEITQGLAEGDTVVVTGAYLLHSEIVLKKGSGAMAEHNH